MIQFILFVSAVVSGLWVPLCLCAAISPSSYCTLVEPNHVWPLSATPGDALAPNVRADPVWNAMRWLKHRPHYDALGVY